jgi:hypothetical protein
MAFRGRGKGVQKVMVQPINLIFRFLQNVGFFLLCPLSRSSSCNV